MNTLVICEKLIEYFEQEVKDAERALERNFGTPLEIVDNAKQRMLGATTLCQYLGIEYLFLEANYEAYTKKLEKLL